MANPLGITLPLRLGQNGYFENTTNPTIQVRTNLTNLLLTVKGERVMQPDFGSNLARLLFETSADDAQAEVESAIVAAAKIWLPFIRIDNVVLSRPALDGHTYDVSIAYTVLTTNITDTIILSF